MENSRKKYSIDFKIWAVKTCIEHKSVRLAADKLQINKNSLQHWKNLFRDGKLTLYNTSSPDSDKKETATLRKELKNIRIERDILQEGAGLLQQERRVVYQFIRDNAGRFPIGKMCRIFQADPSCYYKWIKRLSCGRAAHKAYITSEITRIYHWSQCRYESPRIAKELSAIGIKVSRAFVGKIMMENHLRSIAKTKFRKTTDSSHRFLTAQNILQQDFKTSRCSEVWVSDITYIEANEGWLYLTVVIDLFDRKVIGWSLSENLKAKETSIRAFKNAIVNRPLKSNQKLLFHSDRGTQYACLWFASLLEGTGQITRSMSGRGNCFDNAVAESFFKTLKTELVYHNTYATKEKAKESISGYIENFYNKHRRHSALGNLTIEEFHNQFNIS
jgi:putative transposase